MRNKKSVELLNKAVTDEMWAAHQYMYFHFHCDDQGHDLLASLFRRTAIEEMGHIERLAERILFLGGDVKLKASKDVKAEKDVRKMLDTACALEEQSIKDYNAWANECAKAADSVTKSIFEALVADEERHFDQYDNERENLTRYGDNYLALQSIERAKGAASGTGGEE